MQSQAQTYIPALRFHLLTRMYDPCARLLFGRAFRRIAETIPVARDMRVLDVGCGPGNLLIALSEKEPFLHLTGLDIDPEILAVAKKKRRMSKAVQFLEANATKIPIADGQMDIVVSSLAFHHLSTEQKQEALREIYRVLKPGGMFWLFDFLPARTWFARLLSLVYRYFEEIDDSISGKLEEMIDEAHFLNRTRQWDTCGMIGLLSAKK